MNDPDERHGQGSSPPGGLRRLMHPVRSAGFADEAGLDNGHLRVVEAELGKLLAHPSLARTKLTWAHPGESIRIVKLLDAVQPRTKGRSGAGIFPGFLGPAMARGEGPTHVLEGVAVVAAGYLPRAQEGLVQMAGPSAELSPLGCTINLVIEFEPAEGAPWDQVDDALRRGTLKVAAALAEAALDTPPGWVEELEPLVAAGDGSLPRIGAVINLQTQGAFKDVFVYGRSMSASLPTPIDPNELEDGAVVSGQFGHPALKNPTYLHQNNPVVAALRARDGKDLTFGGLILSPEPVEQSMKEMASAHAARLCRHLGLDAVLVTKEGGGNADSDISLKVDACESMGIMGVGLFSEMSGPAGTGPPVVGPPAVGSAMISTGNYDERLELEAVDRALGSDTFDLTGTPATAAMTVPTAVIYAGLSPLGWGRLTCSEPAQAGAQE